jgi:nitrogen regulatory protein PII
MVGSARPQAAGAPATRLEASIMKYIIAVIQPHCLDAVRDALAEVGVRGLTVSEVRGFGRQKGQTEIYRGAEYAMHYVPKVKLEIAVDAELADRVVDLIGNAARTGRIGDGKIFVLPLEGAMRVRTGEMGADAL